MTAKRSCRTWICGTGAFIALTVALNPLFFVIYRLIIFNTVPRDDYAPFLLWLIGAPGGSLPDLPYGYRLLSMVAAAPFYYLLPVLRVSNLPTELTAPYVRATAALAALSYLSILLSALLIYRVARDRCALVRHEAVLAALVLLGLELNCQFFAIDTFAIMLVAAGLWLLPMRGSFALLIVLSVFCNEKIAIVFGLWLTLRCVTSAEDRRSFRWQWVATMVAIGVYVVELRVLHLPGNSYQLQPAGYLVTLIDNLHVLASARGILLDITPAIVLFAVGALGWWFGHDRMHGTLFRGRDILVIPGLVGIGLVLTQMFQVGRIVTHAAPLFAVPAAAALARWLGSPRSLSGGRA